LSFAVRHPNYAAATTVPAEVVSALAADLD
jgi:hypothetical protein